MKKNKKGAQKKALYLQGILKKLIPEVLDLSLK